MIRTDHERDRLAAELEALDGKAEKAPLAPEETELQALLAHLITEYEDRAVPDPPRGTPLEMLQHIMEQSGLRQADLLDVFGSRALASQILTGKRAISKTMASRLAARFKVSVDLFI